MAPKRPTGRSGGCADHARRTVRSERAERLANQIEAGGVAVNTVAPAQPDTPFGRVKPSGYGYEGGMEGIEDFMHKKLVSAG